jgi:hypothetical protein
VDCAGPERAYRQGNSSGSVSREEAPVVNKNEGAKITAGAITAVVAVFFFAVIALALLMVPPA